MFSVLMRAFSFTLIIIIGIVMKSTGFVPKDAGASVKKFLIYVTLPASIITNFSAMEWIQALEPLDSTERRSGKICNGSTSVTDPS